MQRSLLASDRVLRDGAWELLTNTQTSKQIIAKSRSHIRNVQKCRFDWTEIVPKSPFLHVNRSPIHYSFRDGVRVFPIFPQGQQSQRSASARENLPTASRFFSRGVIFTRARVQHALLTLRKNGGPLVVQCRRDMLLQLVAYSNLKVGTHQATSCSNKSRRQITQCVQVRLLVEATCRGDAQQRQIASCVLENFL